MLVEEQGFEPWAFRMQSGRSATELHPLLYTGRGKTRRPDEPEAAVVPAAGRARDALARAVADLAARRRTRRAAARRAAARRRPRAAARRAAAAPWTLVEARGRAGAGGHGFGPRAPQKQCFGDSPKLAFFTAARRAAAPRALWGAAKLGQAPLETWRYVPGGPCGSGGSVFVRLGLKRRRRSLSEDAPRKCYVATAEASRGLAGRLSNFARREGIDLAL